MSLELKVQADEEEHKFVLSLDKHFEVFWESESGVLSCPSPRLYFLCDRYFNCSNWASDSVPSACSGSMLSSAGKLPVLALLFLAAELESSILAKLFY